MEPKVNYIVVGAFVLLLGFTVLGAIFWLGKTDYRGIYDRYDVYTRSRWPGSAWIRPSSIAESTSGG